MDDDIPSLPDCIILHIFKYLTFEDLCLGARMTCVWWWKISQDAELWRVVDLPEQFTNKRLHMLLKQIQDMVEELDCSKCENLTDYGFLKLISLDFPKLRRLGMPIMPSGPTSGDKLFCALATVCPNLEEIENIHPNIFDDVDPYKCQTLFKNLKVFHDRPVTTYGRIRNVSPKLDADKRQKWRSGITMLSTFCSNIEAYQCVRGPGYIDDLGLKYLSQMLPNIKKLELKQCAITDAGLERFFEHNQVAGGLTEIIFDQPGEITDHGMSVIAEACPCLSTVKLSRCPNITNSGVKTLVAKCPNITVLQLNNIGGFGDKQRPRQKEFDNETMQNIAAKCPKMTNFRLLYSKVVGVRGMNSLVDGCRFLQGLMLFECPAIDDRALQAIQGFNFLKAMALVNCNVSPKGIIDFILVAPCLQRLTLYTKCTSYLGNMDQLTEDTFCKLECDDGEFRPNVLSRLTLRGIGSDFLQLITVLSPSLQSIIVQDAVNISVPSINMVLRNCEFLKVLDISTVPLLDDTFIASLIVNASTLKKLFLGSAVRHLDMEALANVVSTHPTLSMIAMDTHEAPVDEDNFLYIMKRSHNGKAFLHVDPDSRKLDCPRSFRFVEFHCTPIKYLRSVTQPADVYIPVEEFPCYQMYDYDDEEIFFLPDEPMPPLEGDDDAPSEQDPPQEDQDQAVSENPSGSIEDVNAATEVSPQLTVWLGKKLKID